MLGRKTAYHRGYLRALDELKFDLFEEAQRRLDHHGPFTVAMYREEVLVRINRLRNKAIPHLPAG